MSPQRPARGFTLVELLVVIVIIALLAALITPAVMAAMKKAKQVRISTELSQLHSAIEAYKSEHGSYPPSNVAQLKSHLQQRYINIDSGELSATNIPAMDNAQILVFVLRGFSPDKRRPITGGGERKSAFNFDPTRLDTSVTPPRYLAPGTTKPYVYFECSRYPSGSTESYSVGSDVTKPYKINTSTTANAKSFQIISAGLDNDFGPSNTYLLDATNIKDGHIDNITNFSEGKPLIDYIDQ